jgi:carbamoyltransferase
MEFGPRALGNRSILGDPRNPEMKDIINIKVKRRETFRPFAPAVTYESARNYFNMDDLDESSFMLFTVPVRDEIQKIIPSVTHCDGTARIQTVKREDNERFWRLLSSFGGLTGVPVLLNTSFNVKEEPVVCTPDDAVKCFLNTQIDILVIGDYMIKKLPNEEERHGETSDKGRHPGYLKFKGSDVITD